MEKLILISKTNKRGQSINIAQIWVYLLNCTDNRVLKAMIN